MLIISAIQMDITIRPSLRTRVLPGGGGLIGTAVIVGIVIAANSGND
jgi:hypothetical protein